MNMRVRNAFSGFILGLTLVTACSSGGDVAVVTAPTSSVAVATTGAQAVPASPTTQATVTAAASTAAASTTAAATTVLTNPKPSGLLRQVFPGQPVAGGEQVRLPYLVLDGDIAVTAPDSLVSTGALNGLGVAVLRTSFDSPDVLAASNALVSQIVNDPSWDGKIEPGPTAAVPEDALAWFAAQPAVTSSKLSDVSFGGFTGRRLDYGIGALDAVGYSCRANGPKCVSLIAFGGYLRGFAAGETGSLYELRSGSSRLLAVGPSAAGRKAVESLTFTSHALRPDSVAAALVAGGGLTEGTTYTVPDFVDGMHVQLRSTGPGQRIQLEPGWFGIYAEGSSVPALGVFRGDLMRWNTDPGFLPQFPILSPGGAPQRALTVGGFGADVTTAAATQVAEGPSAVNIGGTTGVGAKLLHTGPGLDHCEKPCVAPMFSLSGRVPYLQDGIARRFIVTEVAGQPVVFVSNSATGDALLATFAFVS